MSLWTVEKVLSGLRCIIHQENMSDLLTVPKKHLQIFRSEKRFDEKKMLELLKVVLKGKEEKFDIYGTVEEIFEDLKILDLMPESIKFSTNGVTELSKECIFSICGFQLEDTDKKKFYPKQEIAILFYKTMMRLLVEQNAVVFTVIFYDPWLLSFIHTIREELKGCYEYVSESTWTIIESELKNMNVLKLEHRLKGATAKRFFDQRFRQDIRNELLYKRPLEYLDEMIKKTPIKEHQEFYDDIYDYIDTIINDTKKVHQRYIKVFTPFSGSKIPSQYQTTVVRLFKIPGQQFILAKELEEALKLAIKRRYPKKSFPQGLVKVESEEDRKNGIVFSVSVGEFRQVLKTLGLTEKDLNICIFPLFRDYQLSFLSIISSYGTRCKPALHVFNELVYYITAVLKWFEKTRGQHTQKVLSWIAQFDYLFTEKENMYFIETWKIEDIFNQAKHELKTTFNEAHIQILRKPLYTLPEMLAVLQKLGENVPLPLMFIFESLYRLNLGDTKKAYTIKEVYLCHSQAVKLYSLSKMEKMKLFENNQTAQFLKCSNDKNDVDKLRLQIQINELENKKSIEKVVKQFLESPGNVAQILEELGSDLKALSLENSELRRTEASLKRQIIENENVQRENITLEEQIVNKDNQIKKIKSEFKIARDAKYQLDKSKEKNQKKIANIEKNYRAQICNLKVSSAKKDEMIGELQEKLKKSTMKSENLLQEFEELSGTHQKCEESVNQQKNRQLQQSKASESKNKQIKHLESKNKKLATTIEQIKKENEAIKKKEHTKSNEVVELRQKLELLQQCENKRDKFHDKNVNDRMTKYEAIIRTNYEKLIDTMWSNLHERYPNYNELRSAKSEVKKFDENLNNYLKIVKEDYWKMRDDPNISIDELHPEVEQFPSQDFKDKYERWVFENDLEVSEVRVCETL